MIVCVSPSSQHYDETHNTLKYANRAKEIKTKVSRNVMNVNRHVSQYVKAIFDLRQEVDSLKNRLKDSSKEATDKNNKHRLAKETSIKEGLKRLRAAYDHSKPARDDRINNLRNLKLLERRISLVTAWLESFDVVFENRNGEEAPQSLLKLRVEADKVLKELYSNQQMVKQRLSGPGWDKAMDIALQQGLRSLYTIDGATETDAAVFNTEGNLLRITAERDILEGLNGSDVDSSFTISALTRAHFVAFATLSKVMENNAPEAEAVEAVRKSLFEVQRSAGDAVSQIIKPSGELAPTEVYQPSVYQPSAYQQSANQQSAYQHSVYVSPTKKKSVAYAQSPMKSKLSLPVSVASASPLRSPVRYIKSPRKTHVKFNPRPKKQVQWAEELVDPVSEGSHRRIITNDSFYSAPLLEEDEDEYEDSMLPPPPPVGRLDYESQPLDQAYVPQGVAAPPIRPTRNKLLGSLAAGPPRAPEPSHGPLHSFDNDQVSNLLNEHLSGPGAEDRPWRPTANKPSARSAVRKSIAGGPTRPMTKRRSPSNSSQTSPDLWKTGQRKRMHRRSEKENNGGSMTSVLSPKSSGIRGTARRMTATSGTHGMSSLTLAGLRDSAVAARMRESMTPGGMRRESMAAGAMRRESMAPGTARRESMAPGGMRR